MSPTLLLLSALAVFLLGVWLSAFFSGSETGFYRVSYLRLSIDAQAGDRIARRLLQFAAKPGYFVATVLVGNNVANYLTTLAVGLAVSAAAHPGPWWAEIAGTLLISPIVFIFGELTPKNLYFQAPLSLLRRGSLLFRGFYYLFLPISLPLIGVTRLLERLAGRPAGVFELSPGRERLAQVMTHGRRAGLLTDVQGFLVQGLLVAGREPVTRSITPADRVLGLDESASREQVLEHARRFGLTSVALRRADTSDGWFGYVRVIDLAVKRMPPAALARPMPVIDLANTKLDALLILRDANADFGVVRAKETVRGVVSERGLVEQLFRPPQPPGRVSAP